MTEDGLLAELDSLSLADEDDSSAADVDLLLEPVSVELSVAASLELLSALLASAALRLAAAAFLAAVDSVDLVVPVELTETVELFFAALSSAGS